MLYRMLISNGQNTKTITLCKRISLTLFNMSKIIASVHPCHNLIIMEVMKKLKFLIRV